MGGAKPKIPATFDLEYSSRLLLGQIFWRHLQFLLGVGGLSFVPDRLMQSGITPFELVLTFSRERCCCIAVA